MNKLTKEDILKKNETRGWHAARKYLRSPYASWNKRLSSANAFAKGFNDHMEMMKDNIAGILG